MLNTFFRPKSVAIVGASADTAGLRGKLLKNALNSAYDGLVYPVHPKGGEMQGCTAYASLSDIPGGAELVLVASPGETVPQVIREAIATGAKAAVILSADVDEAALAEAVSEGGLRFTGPNTIGLMALDGLASTFSGAAEDALDAGLPARRPGRKVSIVSQSGGLGMSLFGRGLAQNLDFHAVVTTGNEADLDCLDFVDKLVEEGESGVIVMVMEGLNAPSRLPAIAAKAAKADVALIAVKIGKSEAGQRAAISHTAHLAGADTAYAAVFEHCGINRAMEPDEILAIAAGLARLPRCKVGNVAVISTSGGAGAWAADILGEVGFSVPLLSDELRRDLDAWVPSFGSTENPIDVTAQVVSDGGESLVQVFERLQHTDEIDAIIVNLGLQVRGRIDRLAPQLRPILASATKPIIFTSHILPTAENLSDLAELGSVGFASIGQCARALRGIDSYAAFQERGRAAPAANPEYESRLSGLSPGLLGEAATRKLAKAYGLPIAPAALATDRDEAIRAATEMGLPVVMKIQSPDIAHKTEAGGVRLDVTDGEVGTVFDEIVANARAYSAGAHIEGVLIQKMMPKGHEMVIGIDRDADFGPMLMIGAGGIYLEVMQDVVFVPPPVTPQEAKRLILSLKVARILHGTRGDPAADIDALANLISRVSDLAASERQIGQLDLNPVFVYPEGAGVAVVDMLAVAIDPGKSGDGHS